MRWIWLLAVAACGGTSEPALGADGSVSGGDGKDGSNGFWTAMQVRRHRTSIAMLEARSSSRDWHTIERLNYNYFVDTAGLGDGPYDVRLTDVHGNLVQVDGVEPGDDVLRDTSEQFPVCR